MGATCPEKRQSWPDEGTLWCSVIVLNSKWWPRNYFPGALCILLLKNRTSLIWNNWGWEVGVRALVISLNYGIVQTFLLLPHENELMTNPVLSRHGPLGERF